MKLFNIEGFVNYITLQKRILQTFCANYDYAKNRIYGQCKALLKKLGK